MGKYINCPCCKGKALKVKSHNFCQNCFQYIRPIKKQISYYKGQLRKLKNGEKRIKFDPID